MVPLPETTNPESITFNQQGAPPASLLYVAIRATAEHYRPLLALYNASGMVPDCSPVRMVSFHSAGYDADDCPPNFGVYRSSRVRLFEDPALQDCLHPTP